MLIPDGDFRYEIRRASELIATEEESLAAGKIRGVRHPASGSNVYEVEAELDPDALVRREVDADLVIFRALTIAHIRARGQSRWTGRIAAIDANTLVAATSKQTCRQAGNDPHVWIYEPRMGDSETIVIDDSGCVLRRHDARGIDTLLISRTPATGATT